MIYLEIIEKELKDYVLFDTVEEKDNWINLKRKENKLNNEEPIKIISEGDIAQWIKKRKPNLTVYEQEINKLEKTKQLEKRKIELENELKQIENQLNNLHSHNLILDNSINKDLDNLDLHSELDNSELDNLEEKKSIFE